MLLNGRKWVSRGKYMYDALERTVLTIIPTGGSDTFTVELPTKTKGTYRGTINLYTNQLGKYPFQFSVTGKITAKTAANGR